MSLVFVNKSTFYHVRSMNNSPGHWPKACQTNNNNASNPPYCSFRYWAQGFLEFRKDTIYSILRRGGLGFKCVGPDGRRPTFRPFKNYSRNRSRFHRLLMPKCSQNPSHNHSKSIPGAIPKPTPKK